MRIESTSQLKKLQKQLLAVEKSHAKRIMVCCGPGCLANGAAKLVEEFRKVLKKHRVKGFKIEALKETGCHGFCDQGPLVVIEPKGTFYTKVKVKDIEEIVETSIRKNGLVDRLLYTDPKTGKVIPHSVIEGMILCAFAVGSKEGYVYVRQEYPLAVKNLELAISQAKEYGLLGDNILGTDFSFDIRVSRGAGAFVCGESSALMKSIAGQVGEPRAKYVRSVLKGLHDKPTVLNNVESFANIPVILEKGGEWFASIGTPKSTGTKAFSLVGKVRNTGLIEVPMGTSLREIIYDIGGGIQDDRPFKAVQTGGPSGGCLPEDKLDLPVDFDSLTDAHSMMGSGGMIVMDDHTCVVDLAKYFLSFLVEESCGKCVPCREGLYQLHSLANRITDGRGTEGDIELMEKLSDNIIIGSLCGLGKSGPNPFVSTIRYFRDEYLTHIHDKKCPAHVCTELIRYDVVEEKCDGCMACIYACAVNAITGKKGKLHVIDQDKCTKCGACMAVCRRHAITVA